MSIELSYFPYTASAMPYLLYLNDYQSEFIIKYAITWPGLAINMGESSNLKLRREMGDDSQIDVITMNHLNVMISTIPEWILVDIAAITSMTELQNDIQCALAFFAESGKKLMFAGVGKEEYRIFNVLVNSLDVKTEQIDFLETTKSLELYKGLSFVQQYSRISVPVIFIGGIVNNQDRKEILLRLSKTLKRHNVVASYMVDHQLGNLIGMHSYHHIVNADLSSQVDLKSRLRQLNTYARSIVWCERPSLLVVEVPEAIIKYNDAIPCDFGLTTYVFSEALTPTFMICSLPVNLIQEAFIRSIDNLLLQKYGFYIGAVHTGNYLIDTISSLQELELSWVNIPAIKAKKMARSINNNSNYMLYDMIKEGTEPLWTYISREILK